MNHKNKKPTPPPKTPPLRRRGAHLAPWQATVLGGLAATGLGGCYPDRPGEAAPSSAPPPPNPPQPIDYDAGHQTTMTFDSGQLEIPPQPAPEPQRDAGTPAAAVEDAGTGIESEGDAGGEGETAATQDSGMADAVTDAGAGNATIDSGSQDEVIPERDAGSDEDPPPPQPPPQPPDEER